MPVRQPPIYQSIFSQRRSELMDVLGLRTLSLWLATSEATNVMPPYDHVMYATA